MAPVLGWQQLPFINDQPAGSARTQATDIGNDSRQLRVKMRPTVNSPALAARSPVAEIASFKHVVQTHPGIAVVIVVGLPDVAKGIGGKFVWISEIVAEH